MKKITLSVAALSIAISSLAQTNDTTQCVWGNHVIAWLDKYVEGHGITKNNAKIECKNTTKAKDGLCHEHNPYHADTVRTSANICSGITKKNNNCKNKTKNENGFCYLHINQE